MRTSDFRGSPTSSGHRNCAILRSSASLSLRPTILRERLGASRKNVTVKKHASGRRQILVASIIAEIHKPGASLSSPLLPQSMEISRFREV